MTLKFDFVLLADLWTQGVDASRLEVIDRIHETGLIGGIRWWYEAVIRGLGGYACDPVDDKCRCVFDTDDYERARRGGQNGQAALEKGLSSVCPACRLFGCTGWARKLRLEAQGGAAKGQRLSLILQELRPLEETERWLLVKTMKLITDYGAWGGRTPWKPQKSPKVGKDYGLARLDNPPQIPGDLVQARQWVTQHSPQGKRNHEQWPDLRYFFFVSGQHLERLDLNQMLELDKHGKPIGSGSEVARALRGSIGVSKKIFSFQTPGAQRLWGYGSSARLRDTIVDRLVKVGIDRSKVKTGEEVLDAF